MAIPYQGRKTKKWFHFVYVKMAFFLICLMLSASLLHAEDGNLFQKPDRWRIGICKGDNWSPEKSEVDVVSISLGALYHHDPFFSYKPAKYLRWLLEIQAGATRHQPKRFFVSAGMLVRAQLEPIWRLTGYGLAGIGIIYTDFQVPGQGLRFNFNPQLGLGIDINDKGYFQIRWHHISNGGLHDNNTGVNSWVLQAGLYF